MESSLTIFSVIVPTTIEESSVSSSSATTVPKLSTSSSSLSATMTNAVKTVTYDSKTDTSSPTINTYIIHTTSEANSVNSTVSNAVNDTYTTKIGFDEGSETLTIQSSMDTAENTYDKTSDISGNQAASGKSLATSTMMKESFQYQTFEPTYSPTIYTSIYGSNVSVYSGIAAINGPNASIDIGLLGLIMVFLV